MSHWNDEKQYTAFHNIFLHILFHLMLKMSYKAGAIIIHTLSPDKETKI